MRTGLFLLLLANLAVGQTTLTDSWNNLFTGTNTICRINNIRFIDLTNTCGWAGSDIGAWVNAAEADLPANGGVIWLPNTNGALLQTTPIVITKPIYLCGHGSGAVSGIGTDRSLETTATALKWNGSSGATQVTFTASADAHNGPLQSSGMDGIQLDGNNGLAANNLVLASVENFDLSNFYLVCPSAAGLKFDTVNSLSGYVSNNIGSVHNGTIADDSNSGCYNAHGIQLYSTNYSNGDTTQFSFWMLRIQYKNGDCIHITDADTNFIANVLCLRLSGGTGKGASVDEENGHLSRDLHFTNFDPGAGGVTQSGPGFTNGDVHYWNYYDVTQGNGGPCPTISTGSATVFCGGGANASGAQSLGAITATALFLNENNAGLGTSCTGVTQGQLSASCITNILGTADQVIQSSPAGGSAWSILEDVGALGLALETYNTHPVIISPNRIRTVTFPSGGGIGLGASGTLFLSGTTPTIATGGCGGSGATISASNGTAAFSIGTGSTPTSGGCTVTMPTATTGWVCDGNTVSATSTTNYLVKQTGAVSQTSVVIQNFNDTGSAAAFAGSDTIRVKCLAY